MLAVFALPHTIVQCSGAFAHDDAPYRLVAPFMIQAVRLAMHSRPSGMMGQVLQPHSSTTPERALKHSHFDSHPRFIVRDVCLHCNVCSLYTPCLHHQDTSSTPNRRCHCVAAEGNSIDLQPPSNKKSVNNCCSPAQQPKKVIDE